MATMTNDEADAPAGPAKAADLLYGVPAIAQFLRMKEPQARHLCDNGTLPTFKVGGKVCSRESLLLAWLEDAARRGREAATAGRKRKYTKPAGGK